jgi:hypothetical protein
MADVKPASSERRSPWQRYLAFPLIWKFAIALVVGLIVGLIVGPPIAVVQPLGDLFLRLLQMLVVPLVFLTLLSGAASVSPSNLGRVGERSSDTIWPLRPWPSLWDSHSRWSSARRGTRHAGDR